MKSKQQLDSFVKYCKENPSQRFWQALRNWSEYSFIYGSDASLLDIASKNINGKIIQDTYYLE